MASDIKKGVTEIVAMQEEANKILANAPTELQIFNDFGRTVTFLGEVLETLDSTLGDVENFKGNIAELQKLLLDTFPPHNIDFGMNMVNSSASLLAKLQNNLGDESKNAALEVEKVFKQIVKKKEALEKDFSIEELNTAFAEVA